MIRRERVGVTQTSEAAKRSNVDIWFAGEASTTRTTTECDVISHQQSLAEGKPPLR